VTGVTQSVAGQEKSSRQSPAGGKRMVPLDMEKPLSHLGGVCPRQQAHPERPCLLWWVFGAYQSSGWQSAEIVYGRSFFRTVTPISYLLRSRVGCQTTWGKGHIEIRTLG